MLAGLLLGLLAFRVFERSRPRKFFISLGLAVSFIAYLLFWGVYFREAVRHTQLYGYNAQNQFLLTGMTDGTNPLAGLAFKELQSKIAHPRNLYLHSYFSTDSVLQNNEPLSTYYFTYAFQEAAEAPEYFSKVALFNNKATVVVLNEPIEGSIEFHQVSHQFSRNGHELERNNDTLRLE